MSHRIWHSLYRLLRWGKKRRMEEGSEGQQLSSAEQEVIEPYRKYIAGAGIPSPIVSTAALGGLSAFLVFVGVAATAEFGPVGLLPIPVGLYGISVCKNTLYPRKVKQKELYETLQQEPRRLLDPEYRARFDDIVDADVPAGADASGTQPGTGQSDP